MLGERWVEKFGRISVGFQAGRGLVLSENVVPGQRVMYLSPSSLLHSGTIKHILPTRLLPKHSSFRSLNNGSTSAMRNTSLIPMLLAIFRSTRRLMPHAMPTALNQLSPFLDTMPEEFGTVPLAWRRRVHLREQYSDIHRRLCQILPQRNAVQLEEVHEKYMGDYEQARTAFKRYRSELSESMQSSLHDWTEEDFLWGWLCVNSRCVFLPLGLEPHADNFTLAPMLDMANHTTDPTREFKVKWTLKNGLEMHAPERSVARKVQGGAPEVGYEQERWHGLCSGDEVFITYGAHGNATLLSEYGFVLLDSAGKTGDNPFTDVVLDAQIKRHIEQLRTPSEVHALLEEAGYWGSWTIQRAESEPAHPSWRTVTALRLLAVYDANFPNEARSTALPQATSLVQDIARWKKVVVGLLPHLTGSLELRAATLLGQLAAEAQVDLQRCILAADEMEAEGHQQGAISASIGSIRALAQEELQMLREVVARCSGDNLRKEGPPW
ncbi:hypothetical protein K437DRAFT_140474 [Tilletiaria anomala UBC 951]|uniref:SET domain-containing protein n=1 Tax=Tilletiaria anomala (strain ATCC 24038 / CBS 436.72 / UBC 951) TaxID=1037660 RepID=A0A066VR97_TILAU|nr:uncharacterized protein K437DRAFT_140474 [Tilletiaria anomala UBC 951]KDN44267.1 hypothetical protein K437DRAFT_140474 [Tilletiaria anomala UBC 951]